MLHIILFVLKIIGILVLILLGLVLGVLLLILLVPVRYQIEGAYHDRPRGRAKITWLLHMVSVTAAFEDEFSVVIRLFGMRILKPVEKSREEAEEELVHAMEETKDDAAGASEEILEKAESEGKRERKEEGEAKEGEAPETEAETGGEADAGGEEIAGNKEGAGGREGAGGKEGADGETAGEWEAWEDESFLHFGEAEHSDKAEYSGSRSDFASGPDPDFGPFSGLMKRFRRLAGHFPAFFSKLKFSFRNICDKLKTVKGKKEEIQSWISKEENQKTIRLLFRQGKKLIRHILPRKGKGEVVFGFDDPYTTGQVLTAFSVIYPFCHEQISVCPVFDRQVFTAEGYFKGRVRFGTLLMAAVRLLFDKNCRILLKRWLR